MADFVETQENGGKNGIK
jgi:hypothetical protein